MPEISSKNPDSIPSISFSALLDLFFKAFVQAFKDFIRFFFRHKILILLFIVAGIVTGVVNFKITPVYYKLSMIVRHNELTLSTYAQMLNNLNQLAETGSYEALAKSLKVNDETSHKIRTIGASNLAGTDLRKDTSSITENTFLIQLTIRDNAIADTLEKAIVGYFNNNSYLNKIKQDGIQLNSERLEFVNNELHRMDSLKDAYTRSLAISKGTPSFYNNAFNPAEIYKESNLYSEEKTSLEDWLLRKRTPLLIIDGVKPSKAPYSITLIQSVFIYTVIFFFIGCLLSGILDMAKQDFR